MSYVSWVGVASPSVLVSGINLNNKINAQSIDHIFQWILAFFVHLQNKRSELFFDFQPTVIKAEEFFLPVEWKILVINLTEFNPGKENMYANSKEGHTLSFKMMRGIELESNYEFGKFLFN